MATATFYVSFRPVRIGFLVRDGSVEDIIQAAGINTLLWGGIYNPVVPIGSDKRLAEHLIRLFAVDILYAVTPSEESRAVSAAYPYLRDPHVIGDKIFYEAHTKRNEIAFMDSMHLMEFYYDTEFRHKPKEFKSTWALIGWSQDDALSTLFTVAFGSFPDCYNLENDFKQFFLSGLRARNLKIEKDSALTPEMANIFYPLLLTCQQLPMRPRPLGCYDGIYIGNENSFDDLTAFWNIRSSGMRVEFSPIGHLDRTRDFIAAHLSKLDSRPDSSPNFPDEIAVYCLEENFQEAKKLVADFKTKKKFLFCPTGKAAYSARPFSATTKPRQVLGNIEEASLGYIVVIPVPEKPLTWNSRRHTESQSLVVCISATTAFQYPGHTLQPPFLPDLTEFYSRKIGILPWRLRIERGGIAAVIRRYEETIDLHPLSNQDLILKCFDFAGIAAELSQAGLIAKRIIEKVGGLEGGRVFKIAGVRRLFQEIGAQESTTRSHAKSLFWDEGQFKKHEGLFIERRNGPLLTTDHVFDFLLKHDFLRAGLELLCGNCRQKSWLALEEIGDKWTCHYCGHQDKTSLHLKDRGDWRFKKSGLFAKDNNQEGAIPVVLTLLQLYRVFHLSHFAYSTSLNLKGGDLSCEVDLCVLLQPRDTNVAVIIGECKSEGGAIDAKDVENLRLVARRFNERGIGCTLIFSKTAEEFSPVETELFKHLVQDGMCPILFTSKELEAYEPYEKYRGTSLPAEHPLTLMDLTRNSYHIHLANA